MDAKKKEPETKPSSASSWSAAATEVKKPKSALELLEEDDEFEEFDGASWEDQTGKMEDKQLWKDDWEDDDVNDDFTNYLREQIQSKMANKTAEVK